MSAARTLLALGVLLLGASPAIAELPPQYTTWQDFAAVTSQSAIPGQLGVVDRIERTGGGTYLCAPGNAPSRSRCSAKAPKVRADRSGRSITCCPGRGRGKRCKP